MSYKLCKPVTEEQLACFIANYNNILGLNIVETSMAYFALEKDEMIVDGKVVKNPEYEAQLIQELEEEFAKNFFKVTYLKNDVWYRRKPKGYSSAIESINTVFNAVAILGELPEGYITFYPKPDFSIEEQRYQSWLEEHSFKNEHLTAKQFNLFYKDFVTTWNGQEHVAHE